MGITSVLLAAPVAASVMDTVTAAFWLATGALGTAYFYHCGRTGQSPLQPVRELVAHFMPKPEPEEEKKPQPPRVGL